MRLQSKPRRIAARTTASFILAAAILLTGCGGGGLRQLGTGAD